MRYFLVLISVSFIYSCASMRPNYKFCKESDWREIGMRDGKNDKAMESTYSDYKNMCAGFEEKEMKPNLTMYRFGHDKGVKALCTYTSGKEYGLKQQVQSINCKREKHKKFYLGIRDGVNEYCNFESGYNIAIKGQVTSKVCRSKTHKNFYKGVLKGRAVYCTYQYGHKMGSEGSAYAGICSGQKETEFLKGHTAGKTESQVRKLSTKVNRLEVENARLKEKLNAAESESDHLRIRIQNLEHSLNQQKATSTSIY